MVSRLTKRNFDFCGKYCKAWEDCKTDEHGFVRCDARKRYEKLTVYENLEEDGKLKIVENSKQND